MQKVSEYFNRFCSESDLVARGDESSYWKKACEFYGENKHRNMTDLSPPQAKWLTKIVDDLVESNK